MNGPNDELPWLDDDENVSPEDRELPTSVGIFDGIPNPINPRDPYGCENPVSQEDGS